MQSPYKWYSPIKPPETSIDLKRPWIISADITENDKPVSKRVKTKNSSKGGDPDDVNIINGRNLIEQAFETQQKAYFIEIMKHDSTAQNEISQAIEKNNKVSFATQSKIGQKALIQSKVFEQALSILGDNIEDMDMEKEKKDKKTEFSEDEIGLPDCKVIEEMNRLGLNEISSKKRW